VKYEDGKVVSVEPTDLAPDMIADETLACQLILGRIGLDDALYRPGVQLLGNAATLSLAFVRRSVPLAL
jgi:hypothetical protein